MQSKSPSDSLVSKQQQSFTYSIHSLICSLHEHSFTCNPSFKFPSQDTFLPRVVLQFIIMYIFFLGQRFEYLPILQCISIGLFFVSNIQLGIGKQRHTTMLWRKALAGLNMQKPYMSYPQYAQRTLNKIENTSNARDLPGG